MGCHVVLTPDDEGDLFVVPAGPRTKEVRSGWGPGMAGFPPLPDFQ